jgi:hypothetical protein
MPSRRDRDGAATGWTRGGEIVPSDMGAPDEAVLGRAARERAILLTADKDFGAIAITPGVLTSGVVLFRRSVTDPAGAAARLLALIEEHGDSLYRLYAVVTPARARVRKLAATPAGES